MMILIYLRISIEISIELKAFEKQLLRYPPSSSQNCKFDIWKLLNSKALQSLLKVLLNGIKINLKNKFNIVKNSILVLLLEVHFKNHHV
jgi:hypothetical protein